MTFSHDTLQWRAHRDCANPAPREGCSRNSNHDAYLEAASLQHNAHNAPHAEAHTPPASQIDAAERCIHKRQTKDQTQAWRTVSMRLCAVSTGTIRTPHSAAAVQDSVLYGSNSTHHLILLLHVYHLCWYALHQTCVHVDTIQQAPQLHNSCTTGAQLS